MAEDGGQILDAGYSIPEIIKNVFNRGLMQIFTD